jgi:predicted SAM-dependent methyltransferase
MMGIKAILRPVVHAARKARQRRRIRKLMADTPRVALGSGRSSYDRWISTDIDILDITSEKDWKRCFEPESLEALLAEHVWEHLTPEQAAAAARNCFNYLKPGGYLRIAVPDGFHPSEAYIKWVTEGPPESGADDHKVLYNYKTFSEVFSGAGFQVRLLEYYDENGVFHFEEWDPDDGYISRSKRYDPGHSRRGFSEPFTSIIIDAVKA